MPLVSCPSSWRFVSYDCTSRRTNINLNFELAKMSSRVTLNWYKFLFATILSRNHTFLEFLKIIFSLRISLPSPSEYHCRNEGIGGVFLAHALHKAPPDARETHSQLWDSDQILCNPDTTVCRNYRGNYNETWIYNAIWITDEVWCERSLLTSERFLYIPCGGSHFCLKTPVHWLLSLANRKWCR